MFRRSLSTHSLCELKIFRYLVRIAHIDQLAAFSGLQRWVQQRVQGEFDGRLRERDGSYLRPW